MPGTANPGRSKAKYAARDSHLDQDAAGRLLEGTSDRACREMTVPTVVLSDRTRLIDLLPLLWQTTALSELSSERAVVRPAAWTLFIQACGLCFLAFTVACASAPAAGPAPVSVNEQALPAHVSSKTQWILTPDTTPQTYHSSAVALLTAASRTDTTRLSSQYIISFHRQEDLVRSSGFLSFMEIQTTVSDSSAPSGLQGVPFSGHVSGMSIVLDSIANSPINASTCSHPASGLITMLIHRHAIVVPPSLVLGATWRDTASITACYGTIPMLYRISRDYKVLGETDLNGKGLLLIARTDSLDGSGEGPSGQHRVVITLKGSSLASLYLNPEHGTLASAEIEQRSDVSVTTSGRTQIFRQQIRESVQSLVPFN